MTPFNFSRSIEELEAQLTHVSEMEVGEKLEPVRQKLLQLIEKGIRETKERMGVVLTPETNEQR